ncbi:PIF-1 [Choristoneura rosaceana nucleopolyhedrovirus]|uniref:PIF-1 n=1 Tax=Choristoneura rosaceana nucleopolyhedrovirus TaxID=58094 RepID=S5MKT7_9ABAC|nr:PIF-1 [Choristoneura rosaceana nucleopolyhedrovirus]AGR57076.1 PIF-1 [Choristoneura rosaceana nucleopolyhedrovirus]
MYLPILIFVLLLIIIATAIGYVNFIDVHHENVRHPLQMFDTSDVPLIEPPNEIVIEGNDLECHKILTPCVTHADCNACREGLANCQLFDEDTVVQMHDVDGNEQTVNIRAGESYCFALDRERARSCNPSTGVWLLAETKTGFALLCSCLRPGLVTQLNMYEDCNVPVGCAPHGHIANMSGDIRCVCDEGYVSDYDAATETPFCRSRTVRDVLFDEAFFPRAPCGDGQVRLDHPGLNDYYRRYFRMEDICVVDPCSVDPISGRRTSGRLFHHTTADNVEVSGCNCPAADGLLPVFNRHTADSGMVRGGDRNTANACLQPFNVHMLALRHVDYKFFWARPDHNEVADADIVFQTTAAQLSDERYRAMLYPLFTPHPDVTDIMLVEIGVLKISVSYDTVLKSASLPASIFSLFKNKERATSQPACFFPGEGRCVVANSDDCIRRHGNAQVWTAESFTGSRCVLSRDGANIKIWSRAGRYPWSRAPAALRVRGFFLNNDRERNTVRVVTTGDMTSGTQIDSLTQVLETFSNYSV